MINITRMVLIKIIRNTDRISPDGYSIWLEHDFINWADIQYNIIDIGETSDNVIKSTYRGNDIFELESLPMTNKIYIYYMKEITIKADSPCNKVIAYMQSDNTKYTYYTDKYDVVLDNLYNIGSYKTADDYDTYIHFTPECLTTDYYIDIYREIVYPEEDIIGSRFEVCVQEYEYELLDIIE